MSAIKDVSRERDLERVRFSSDSIDRLEAVKRLSSRVQGLGFVAMGVDALVVKHLKELAFKPDADVSERMIAAQGLGVDPKELNILNEPVEKFITSEMSGPN